VNNQATTRKGEYFYRELAIGNATTPVSEPVNVVGARNNFGAGGEDAVTEKGGRVVLPAFTEAFTYDDDGNLIADGLWTYTWDGNNRLISMQSTANVPVTAKTKVDFVYDYAGRRISKNVSTWNITTSAYELQSTTKFVYDSWNVIAELDGSNALTRSFVWGSDVSGKNAAGGIGGLLLINEGGATYQAGYDGNGNVGLLVKSSDGSIAASYEYDAFGNVLKATGDYASRNPFRFSTKYADEETGLVYYGLRYVNAQTGKWLSRDPIAEQGSSNLYLYNDNDPVNLVDAIGLQQNPHTDGWLGPIADAFKFKHYIKSSPNWDFARHTMYRSFHTMTLRVCMNSKDAIEEAWNGLKNFHYFEPNLASVQVNGDRGHFKLSWWEFFSKMGSATPVIGNSIDVLFHRNEATKEQFAVTTGDHPLVGVRKWWTVENPRNHSKKEILLVISTEAYEQANGLVINALGRWWPIDGGHQKQSRMWSNYLRNIADAWKKNHKARLEESPPPVVETTSETYNPFRGLLPPNLRESQYYYDYSPF
jgi:RHS repeat-associated protein